MKKINHLFLNFLPIVLMVALIPVIKNDYILAAVYVLITIISLALKKDSKEIPVFFLGLVILTISESIFISTGVETFQRHTLFGIMPIWLPILWGYGFVAIKRGLEVI